MRNFLCFFVWKNCAIFPYEKTKGAKGKAKSGKTFSFGAQGKRQGGQSSGYKGNKTGFFSFLKSKG